MKRLCLLLALVGAAPVAGQGPGSAGAQVLQFNAGSRAAAFSGAYTAASSDAEALFYNPAGAAALRLSGALSYEAYVEDIALASFAGTVPAGRLTLGLSFVMLDAGEIEEIVPDPAFGGNTGMPSGSSASASETALRVSAATSWRDGRLRLGAGAGLVNSSIADASRSAPVFDAGLQYDLDPVTVGLAVRNLGGSLSGDGLDADLPGEARLGVAADLTRAGGLGFTVHADLLARLADQDAGFLIGVEGGLRPAAAGGLAVVGRAGFSGAQGEGGLAALKLGGGLALGPLAVDYAYQNLDAFGAVHRFGLRYTR